MSDVSTTRLGFVGVGSMGQCAHLRNYVTIPECEVVAISELRRKTSEAVARRYGVPRVYSTAAEMLAEEELDGIVASQPFNRHGVLLPQLLEAGKPIFIEKPLSASIACGEAIVRALEQSTAWIMVGYHKRSDPATEYAIRTVRELQESGEIGKMKYVRILMPAGDWIASGFTGMIDGGDPRPPLEWEPPAPDMEPDMFGAYTSFVNYYIHQVNLMRHFLGEPYTVRYADPSGVMLAGASASGVACVIEMSPYQTTIDWQESVLVAFERGWVKVELPAPLSTHRPGRVEVFKDPGNGAVPETIVPQLPWEHAMHRQARNFVAAIRGDRKPPCEAREALEDLHVAREYIRLWKGV